MMAAEILKLNGDPRNPKDSGMMEVVRRFHSFAQAHGLPYCVVGGMAVIRNGYDAELGANFLNLHSLVQLKAAVYMNKLNEQGANTAAKDQSDVYELIRVRPGDAAGFKRLLVAGVPARR